MKEIAYAKVNLCLDVTERLPDGYHNLRGIMQSLRFGDRVTLEPGLSPWVVRSNLPFLPGGETNLAAQAALLFRRVTGLGPLGGVITLDKRIPVCGGFGGGSSDAAAVLRLLNRCCGFPLSWEELERISLELGADVPFCIRGGTALAEGKGERLTPLPDFSGFPAVICRPDFLCSTPELFRAVDRMKLRIHPDVAGMQQAVEQKELPGVARRLFNVFEEVLPKKQQEQIWALKEQLLDRGALGASMTGSGSGIFALFAQTEQAEAAASDLRQAGVEAERTETGERLSS